jgi:(p)ppGpp synthase/HD superfamily hydrolase
MELINMIDFALEIASKAHKNQLRKGTDIPYIVHPAGVALILSQLNCPVELIVAGILHDVVEDSNIEVEFIKEHFGEKVALIVEGCTEPLHTSLPWEDRKMHTIEFLKTAPEEIRIVSCADKLHNLRSVVSEYKKYGDGVWERFKRGKEKQEWYFRKLVESFVQNHENDTFILYKTFKKEVEEFFGVK